VNHEHQFSIISKNENILRHSLEFVTYLHVHQQNLKNLKKERKRKRKKRKEKKKERKMRELFNWNRDMKWVDENHTENIITQK
jgi:hypothetical protein